MKFDAAYFPSRDYGADAIGIAQLESAGVAAVWALRSARNPFFSLSVAAAWTRRIQLGVLEDATFSRSPMVTAQIGWDLARQSGGRFALGLGGAPPAHQSDAFDEDYGDAEGRMREVIKSLRAIWRTFQNDERLRFRGDYYRFRLMAPFFNPGPIDCPDIPLWLTADDLDSCRLAGEMCQGLSINPLHSVDFLRDAQLPALHHGLRQSGRPRQSIEVAAPVFLISGSSPEFKSQAKQLAISRMTWLAKQSDMRHFGAVDRDKPLNDEALNQIAIVAEPTEVVSAARQRFKGLVDRVCMIWNWDDEELTEAIASALKRIAKRQA